MIINKIITCIILAFLVIRTGYIQAPTDKNQNPYGIATYECASVYWKTPEAGICKIRYKESNKSTPTFIKVVGEFTKAKYNKYCPKITWTQD